MTMRERLGQNHYLAWLAVLTIVFSFGWFWLDGNIKLNLADEGYLWYGTQALRHGQVPMRDFEAYDPGRYLWGAAWSFLLGDGVVALRLSCVFFQCIGVFAGLLTARRLSKNWLFLACVALSLCAWMHPRFKLFEQSIALMALYAGVLLLECPTLRRHWWVGVFGGLTAFMGRNHGAYHIFAFGVLIALAGWTEGWPVRLRRSFVWGSGLLVGYLPQWLMFLFVPGYFHAFVPYVRGLFAGGGTNLARSVAWPWLVPLALPTWVLLSALAEGCFYVALLVFLVLALLRLWQLRHDSLAAHSVLIASGCIGIPYTHFVFSRPDIVHLTHGAPTMVVGAIALAFTLPGRWKKLGYVVAPVVLGLSLLANLFQFGLTLELLSPEKPLFAVEINGERMLVEGYHVRVLVSAMHLVRDLAKPGEAILFAPHTPGLYPITGKTSPTKQIYFVFPAPPEVDQALVDELKAADLQWAMLQDYALDGRDGLRFRHTNPLVFDYLRKNFGAVPMSTLPHDMVIWHRLKSQ